MPNKKNIRKGKNLRVSRSIEALHKIVQEAPAAEINFAPPQESQTYRGVAMAPSLPPRIHRTLVLDNSVFIDLEIPFDENVEVWNEIDQAIRAHSLWDCSDRVNLSVMWGNTPLTMVNMARLICIL